MINLEYTEHQVREIRSYSPDLYELVVDRNEMAFSPGDCVAIYTEHEKSRPYSISSGTGEEELRFIIREMDGGEVSPWLKERNAGEPIKITPPFGWFRPGQGIGKAPFAFLATGTGIAPFLSYMHSLHRKPEYCLYGVRKESDAAGFKQMLNFCPARLAVSREKTEHHHGRITDLMHELPLTPETHYYCCGLESMVNETTEWLQREGIELSKIHREVFFHG